MNKRKIKQAVRMEDYNPSDAITKQPKSTSNEQISLPPYQKPDIKNKPENGLYEIVEDLPTGGKLYPEGVVIKARPLNVIEVKLLANMTKENANEVVDDILERTVIGIDINDIYVSDKFFIALYLRYITYDDSGYEVNFECSKCKQNTSYAFELDKLDIKSLSDDDIDKINEEFVLPNGDKIKYRYLRIKDEKDNTRFLRQNKNSMMNFDEEILTVCRMVDKINGERKGMIDKYIYLTTKISPTDYAYLESYLEDVTVGVEPILYVKCKKCGGASETMLPFRPDFFLPKVQIK